MTILMAGGGVKPGSIVGATDEIGAQAVEVAHPIRDCTPPSFICSGWTTTSSPSFTQDATSNSASSADKSSAN